MKKKMMMMTMKMTDDGEDNDDKDGYDEGRPLVASIGKTLRSLCRRAVSHQQLQAMLLRSLR